MEPRNDQPQRPLPPVSTITTCTYSGPITRPAQRQHTQTDPENNDRDIKLLAIVVGRSAPVTYVYDKNLGRCHKKEESE